METGKKCRCCAEWMEATGVRSPAMARSFLEKMSKKLDEIERMIRNE